MQPADWEGSTFTISNLGMFGVDEFTAIINPPDACILAVGGIQQMPVVKDGQVKPGNVMKVTLSCDHRVVDGASGAAFLLTLKSLLEEPLRMLDLKMYRDPYWSCLQRRDFFYGHMIHYAFTVPLAAYYKTVHCSIFLTATILPYF